MAYELPESTKGARSQSTKQRRQSYSTSSNQRNVGESWFNDSFEESEYDVHEVRYASHPEVKQENDSNVYEVMPDPSDPSGNGNGDKEENLYEIPDSMNIATSKAATSGEEGVVEGSSECYECPSDAMEYGNVMNSGINETDIYDDTY